MVALQSGDASEVRTLRQPKTGKLLVDEITEYPVPGGGLAIWHLNQSGFVFKHDHIVFYIDPYLSNDLVSATKGMSDQHTKIYEPLLRGSDVNNANYVFCTHDHLDHLDPTTIWEISQANEKTRFIVPFYAHKTMERLGISTDRVIYLGANEKRELPELNVRALKGAHETFDYDEHCGFAYLGFYISIGNFNIFHAGDTVLHDELVRELRKLAIDLAFLPINGREYFKLDRNIRGNMNYKDAADLAAELNVDTVFPCHWGMHYENTESPGNFVNYITERYRYQKFRVMVPGDRIVYFKN
ncbi:MAG: MBL fold metallo-hydrolase [Desulfitobacteriaceae bacterium]